MRIPKMQASPQYRVTVPALDGGVNLKEAPNLVGDNQLTDARNVWWKDQALRTRPGLLTDEGKCTDIGARLETNLEDEQGYPQISRRSAYGNADVYQDGEMVAVVLDEEGTTSETTAPPAMNTAFIGYAADGSMKEIADRSCNDGSYYFTQQLVHHRSGWYAFTNSGTVLSGKTSPLTPSSVYVPLLAVNGKGYETEDLKGSFTFSGTMFEGFNTLVDANGDTPFRVTFTTDGKANAFPLPVQQLSNHFEVSLEIRFTQYDGSVTVFHIPYDKSLSTETAFIDDHMTGGNNATVYACIHKNSGLLYFQTSGVGTPRYVAPDPSVPNNLEVTAWVTNQYEFYPCDMTFHTWFGGDTGGINGGTRLFMAGDKTNLICWSDADNPLYFPENNYARVGDSAQKITAFGKQSDILVIFKERELFYATYKAGTGFSAQDVMDGKVVDVAANMATFPIAQINAGIGCDCPQTIQLCNNRLVWATSEGKVYTLTDATPYSERNVRELSGMVESHLKAQGKEALRTATSGDYNGHYVLQVGDWLYLLDYNSSGYEYHTSYTGKNAERHMPWSIWNVALPGVTWKRFFAFEDKAVLIGEKEMNNTLYRLVYPLEGNVDSLVEYQDGVQITAQPIPAMFQTKVFDFDYPERRKNIRRLYIGATDTADGYIRLAYITEQGTREDALRLGDYGSGEMRQWMVTPGVNRVRQFGLKAESNGYMAVDNLVIKYEVNGEVR